MAMERWARNEIQRSPAYQKPALVHLAVAIAFLTSSADGTRTPTTAPTREEEEMLPGYCAALVFGLVPRLNPTKSESTPVVGRTDDVDVVGDGDPVPFLSMLCACVCVAVV